MTNILPLATSSNSSLESSTEAKKEQIIDLTELEETFPIKERMFAKTNYPAAYSKEYGASKKAYGSLIKKQPRIRMESTVQKSCGRCCAWFEPGEPALFMSVTLGFFCSECARNYKKFKEDREESSPPEPEKKKKNEVIHVSCANVSESDSDDEDYVDERDKDLDSYHLFTSKK